MHLVIPEKNETNNARRPKYCPQILKHIPKIKKVTINLVSAQKIDKTTLLPNSNLQSSLFPEEQPDSRRKFPQCTSRALQSIIKTSLSLPTRRNENAPPMQNPDLTNEVAFPSNN